MVSKEILKSRPRVLTINLQLDFTLLHQGRNKLFIGLTEWFVS